MTRTGDRLYEMTRTLTEVEKDIASLEGKRWGGRMEVSGRKWVFYIGIICILFSFLLIAIYYYQPNMDFLWNYIIDDPPLVILLMGIMLITVMGLIGIISFMLGRTPTDAEYVGMTVAGVVIFLLGGG